MSEGKGVAVATESEADALPECEKALIVSQTTFPVERYQALCERICKRVKHPQVLNTICPATQQRQKAARDVAAGWM